MNTDLLEKALANISVRQGERSTTVISGEIPFAILESERKGALETIGKDIEIKGFRKGHIPEKVLVSRVGEMAVITEMAERALAKIYPDVVKKHNLDVIGRPDIRITKIAADNPLGFEATVAIMPALTLPDYKAIAKAQNAKRESAEVTEKDLADAIERVQRQKRAHDHAQETATKRAAAEKDGLTLPTPETAAADTDIDTLPLPELTDAYVATLGAFTSVDDFKKQYREHLEKEKKQEVAGKHRATVTDTIVEGTIVELPQIMIDAELGQMFAQMSEDLSRAGLTLEGYLEHVKKSREDLVAEWTPTATKRAKLQLVLNEIAKKEEVEPDKEKIAHDVSHLMDHYKDADPIRVRIYVESMARNEKVLELLDNQ